MSMFDLKGGSGNGWNYSDSTKQGYAEVIQGTVVEISNPQALNFSTRQPEFWPDGNPKRNLQLCILLQDGRELSWTFAPRSAAANACLAALDPQNQRPQVSIEELLGKMVQVQTASGVYNAQNPRPWWVTIMGDGQANMVRGLKDLSKPQPMGGMQMPQRQQPAQQQQPPVQQQQQPPAQIQAAQQRAAQALGYQQPPAQQQQQQPAQQQPPVQQVPYGDPGAVYDQDIPF